METQHTVQSLESSPLSVQSYYRMVTAVCAEDERKYYSLFRLNRQKLRKRLLASPVISVCKQQLGWHWTELHGIKYFRTFFENL